MSDLSHKILPYSKVSVAQVDNSFVITLIFLLHVRSPEIKFSGGGMKIAQPETSIPLGELVGN